MADVIRIVPYFKVQIADKPGTLAGALAPLREAGGNLLAVHAFPRSRRTQVDVVSGVFVGTLRPRMAVALLDRAAVESGGNLLSISALLRTLDTTIVEGRDHGRRGGRV